MPADDAIALLIAELNSVKAKVDYLLRLEKSSYTAHAPVTLDMNSVQVNSLTGQELGHQVQAHNCVWSGPESGAAAVPTFRLLVAADLPAAIAARYTTNAEQSIANVSQPVIDFEDVVYDALPCVTTGAAWKFTAPIAGIYHAHAHIRFASSAAWTAGESSYLEVFVNGTVYASSMHETEATETLYREMDVSADVSLAAGGYLDFRPYQDSGSAIALSNTGVPNYAEVYLIR